MKSAMLCWMRKALLVSVAAAGMLFAVLLLSASVSVIGFKISASASYGVLVFLIWFMFDVLGRFGGDRFGKHEPWIMMGAFFLMYLVFLQIVPELGQIKMPYDSMRVQKSLEAGHFAFFRPWKFYYWINYDFLLSALGMVFAPKLIVGQILNAVCRVLALYPIFRLCERVSGRRMARFVTIMVGLSPTLTIYASLLVGDYLSALFYLYAVYLFLSVSDWGHLSLNNVYLWILIGLLAGVGFLFKSLSFLYFAAFVVWMVVKWLESRSGKVVLSASLALLFIFLSHGMVKSARSVMFQNLRSDSKVQIAEGEGFISGILYEMYLGMYIPSMGGYVPARDKAFRAVSAEKKIEMVKDMLVKDAKNYPKFIVDKFRMIWGANDDPIGSVLNWFRMSCQNDCYNIKDKNHCVAWLTPLLRAEHLFFAIAFFLGVGGFLLSIRKSLDFTGIGIVSLVIVLMFAFMSVLIESQGRYRVAIYPFFFLLIPYSRAWLNRGNPLYTRVFGGLGRIFGSTNNGGAERLLDGSEVKSQVCGVQSTSLFQPEFHAESVGCISLNREKIQSVLVCSAIGILLFFVSVAAVVKVIDLKQDYPTHIMVASKITLKSLFHPIAFLRENCYPVWHILTWLTANVFGCDGRSAAAVVTGGSVVGAWAYAVLYFSRKYCGWGKDIVHAASVCLVLVAPIWLPFFNPNLILGQGGPNLWHNPTNLMVRLVAFPCFVWYAAFMDGIGKDHTSRLSARKLILLSLLVLLATLSKPSFVQMFFPAIFLLALFKVVKYRKAAIGAVSTVALSFIPTLLLMALQAWVSFYSPQGGGGGVAIAFMKVYSHYSPNIVVSVILGILFPLVVLLWSIRAHRVSTADVLAWIMYGIALVEGAFLIETGRRMWHANFTWATNLALFYIWFTAIDRFIFLTGESGKASAVPERKWWFRGAVVALSLHLVSGICYLWRILVLGIWL